MRGRARGMDSAVFRSRERVSRGRRYTKLFLGFAPFLWIRTVTSEED